MDARGVDNGGCGSVFIIPEAQNAVFWKQHMYYLLNLVILNFSKFGELKLMRTIYHFQSKMSPKELPYLVCYFREASLPCHLLDYTDDDNLAFYYTFPTYLISIRPVLRIHAILVRIRIRGSIPLTNGYRSVSGSCYFRQ